MVVTLPVEMAERLLDLAASHQGINDAPTLVMFSEARLRIERAKRKK